jgi:hypothetical protein
MDIIGQTFTRLTVEAVVGKDLYGHKLVSCSCSCGGHIEVRASDVRRGTTKSCGCLKEGHGLTDSPTYTSWRAMKGRCLNENASNYDNYGGRGIRICDRWLNFESFLLDMGHRPKGKTLDRIDPDGNYEPSNCRWATAKQQANNQRRHMC